MTSLELYNALLDKYDEYMFLNLLDKYNEFMFLKLYVNTNDDELINKYNKHVNEHNTNALTNTHIDAGFDLFCPEMKLLTSTNVNKIDYQVVCNAKIVKKDSSYNTGFYMYPRSSISKSNLRLANNVGIIDAGYRGNLIGMFDLIYKNELTINKFDRHLQICAPNLMPIIVEMVNTLEELGDETTRGNGGFGSTGV
jgi:dUTP pyrophosphatase